MNYTIGTRYEPCTVVLKIRSLKACTVRLQVYDSKQENTFLTNRLKQMFMGEESILQVQMPLSPNIAAISVFDEVAGNRVANAETSFEIIGKIRQLLLPRLMGVSGMRDKHISRFVKFAQRFCYNAGILPTNGENESYCSDNKDYHIRYLPILSDEPGLEVTTPARINKYTRVIEVSKRKFVDMTVPERICILLHEFCHLYENKDAANELEADLNGLTIYLSLGYPRIEALNIFENTFYAVPTAENLERYKHIENFINRFDNYYFSSKK